MTDKRGRKAKVFMESTGNNGRKYVDRYFGLYEDDVKAEVEEVKKKIDPMRSPSTGSPYKWGTFTAIDLTYYGLD